MGSPLLLQAEQAQFLQPLLAGQVPIMVASAELAPSYQQLFCIRCLKLDAVPRCDASSAEQSGGGGGNHLPQSTGYMLGDTVQDAAGQLGCQGGAVCKQPQGLSCRAGLPSPCPQPVLLPGALPSRFKTRNLSLQTIFRFSIFKFLLLSRNSWLPALLLSISPGHPPRIVSPENTIRLHHIACSCHW